MRKFPLWLSVNVMAIMTFGTSPANAHYDKTKWGMSLANVRALYPGGTVKRNQNRERSYAIVRPIANLMTALVIFNFDKKGLKDVKILFPLQGTEIDLKNLTFTEPMKSESDEIFKIVSTQLTLKYGKPDPLSKEGQQVWTTKDDDIIFLSKNFGQNPSHAVVGIKYEKTPGLKDISSGL